MYALTSTGSLNSSDQNSLVVHERIIVNDSWNLSDIGVLLFYFSELTLL